MADWSKGFEEQRQAQVENPFQPSGLSEVAADWDPVEAAKSPFGPSTYNEASQAWFGGRNTSGDDPMTEVNEGTTNGWDTPFFAEMMAQRQLYLDKAAQADDSREFFNWLDPRVNKDATGVALWNDPRRNLRAGDVYEKGQFKHNVYDVYDKPTADLLMSAVMFDGPEQARINESGGYGDGGAEVRAQKVQKFIDETTEWAAGAESAAEFKARVEAKKAEYGAGGTESAVGSFLAGAGAGAITGGGIGAAAGAITGPGAAVTGAIGAVAGALAGGFTAWMNRDQITEVAARSSVKAELQGQTNGYDAGILAGLQGVGETAMLAGQPGQNLVQGWFDADAGTQGDGISEFYAIDPATGRTKPSAKWEAFNVVAALGDSVAQFASPTGRALYMGTMGTYTAGKAGSLITSDAAFNEETGTWDTLDKPSEYIGAYGSVAIDAVQMGTVGAFAGRTKSIQQAAGVTPRTDADLVRGMWRALPGGKNIPKGADSEVVSGLRVFKNAEGAIVAARPSIQLAAPSEAIRYVAVGQRARRAALKAADAGRVGADDFYRAHLDMAYNATKWQNALLTGFAEGAEEAAQALLDPMAYSGDYDGFAVARSAAYGFASGAGMALGSQLHLGKAGMRGRSDQMAIMRQRARENVEIANAMQFSSQEEWEQYSDGFTDEMILALATRKKGEVTEVGQLIQAARDLQAYEEGVHNPLGLYTVDDITTTAEGSGDIPNGYGQLKLAPLIQERLFDSDGTLLDIKGSVTDTQMSWWQVGRRFQLKIDMFDAHEKDITATIAQAQAAKSAAEAAGEQSLVAEADALIASAQKDLADITELGEVMRIVSRQMAGMWDQYIAETDENVRRDMIDTLNIGLRAAADNGRWILPDGGILQVSDPELIQRAVEIIYGRQPLMGQSSQVRLVPQVSYDLTRTNAHGVMQLHQTVLKILNADFDGDDGVDLSGTYFPKPTREALRRGSQFVIKDPKQTGEPDAPHAVVMDAPDMDAQLLNVVRQWAQSRSVPAQFVDDELETFSTWLLNRYDGVLDAQVLNDAVVAFQQDVTAGNPDARMNLLNTLVTADRTAVLQTGQDNGVQEIPYLSGQITLALSKMQRKMELYDYTLRRNSGITDPATVRAATTTAVNSLLEEAATLGADMSLLLGPDAQRAAQKSHYLSWIRAAVEGSEETAGMLPDKVIELARLYMLLGSNEIDTQMEKVERQDVVIGRVRSWLRQSVLDLGRELGKTYTPAEEGAMMLALSQSAVTDFDFQADGTPGPNRGGQVTVLQMMLRRSVQIERLRYEQQQGDTDTVRQLRALERLTLPQKEHSYSASAALLEVFGGMQLGELLGDLHASLGPNMTVAQLQQELIGLASYQRTQKIHLMKNGIGYFKHHGLGDPPFMGYGPDGIAQQMMDGRLNGYTLLVDALQATADTHYKAMKSRSDTVQGTVEDGFKAIALRIDQWEKANRQRLNDLYPEGATEQERRHIVLLDLMKTDPDLPKTLQALFTEDSRLATFRINQQTGEIVVKAWVMDALTETNIPRAVVKYYVGSHLDQYQQLGAQVEHENRKKAAKIDAKETLAGVPYGRIRSRFLQNLHIAARYAAIDGGFTLNQLQKAMFDSKNMEELFAVFNDNPLIMNGREQLVPWYDDVADFETLPNELFNSAMPGAVLRERFTKMTNRLEHMTAEARQLDELQNKSRLTIDQMVRRFDELGGDDSALLNLQAATQTVSNVDELLLLLKLAIEHRRNIPPIKGMNIYDQAIEAAQQAVLIMHDKAKADERLRNLGAVVFANTSMGAYGGPHAELNNITTLAYADVASNFSMLSEGPVRIMYPDGTYTPVVDLSTVAGVLAALKDPRTEMLARAVVLPTSLDVNIENALQEYSLNADSADLADALKEERFAGLLDLAGDNRVANAYSLLGLIESAALGRARSGPTEELAAASHVGLHLINDFVVAYMHAPQAAGKNDKRLRQQLVVDVVDALRRIAMIKDPELRAKAQRLLKEELRSRVLGDDPIARMQRDEPETYAMLTRLLEQHATEAINRRQTELAQKLATLDPNDPAYVEAIEETERLQAVEEDSPLRILAALNPQSRFITVETALASFQIDDSSEETKAASIERVLTFLGTGSALARLQNKDNAVLLAQVQTLLGQLRTGQLNPEDVAVVDWQRVSELAATVLVSQSLSPTAAWVGLSEIDLGDPIQTSYMDHTFSYLVDRLFDPTLIDATEYVIEASMSGVEVVKDIPALVREFSDRLFKPENLGTWTTRIPVESTKVRRAVNGTPANRELETKGSIPKTMQAYVNAGMVTFELPDPATAHSTVSIDVTAGEDLTQFLYDTNPAMLLKLEHHFFASLKLVSPDLQDEVDLFEEAGLPAFVSDEVTQSGYKVLTLEQLQRAVDRVAEANPQMRRYTLSVEFVDVDKRPPTPQFVNNIYFDGVGREFEGNSGTSPVAAMFFRTMALNNLGQQRPLDFMKSGMAFYTYQTSDFRDTLTMEAGVSTITELMWRKALHMAGRTYETGRLQMADLPALYKLVKFRHIIRTQDGEFIWPEEAIARESAALAAGEQLPLFEVIPISDDIAKTLFQQNSLEGVPGSVRGLPLFNQTDSTGLPALDQATLKRLGLENLGQQRELAEGPAATVGLLTKSYLNDERGAAARGAKPRRIPTQDAGVIALELGRRQRQTTGDNTPQQISTRNEAYIRSAIELEALLPSLPGTRVELTRQQDTIDDLLSSSLAARVRELKASPLNTTWLMTGAITEQKISGMATGVLTKADVEQGFDAGVSSNNVIYGDVVAIDLVGIRDGLFNGNNEETIRYITGALKQLSERGVAFVLMSKGAPSPTLRAEIADWITTALPYQSVAGSSYFFEPITELNDKGATSRAERSSLTESHTVTGRNLTVWGVNPTDLSMSEGGGFIYEQRMRETSRFQHVIIPTQFTTSHPELDPQGYNGSAFTFGLPTNGLGNQAQLALLQKFLLPLLRSEAGRETLRQMASGKEASPDPTGVPIFKRHTDGLVEPGIRSFEDAMDVLVDVLSTGELLVGRDLLPGDIIPVVDSKQNLVLMRYGFDFPKDFLKQFNSNAQQEALVDAAHVPTPFRVAVSPPKLVPTQTTTNIAHVHSVQSTARGMEARVSYPLQKTGKIVGAYEGLKFGLATAPRDIQPVDLPMSLQPNNHISIVGEISQKAVVGKGATQQLVNNFRNGFAFFGIDFEDALLEFFAPFYDTRDMSRAEQMDYIRGFLQEWASAPTNMDKDSLIALLNTNILFEGIAAELRPMVTAFFPQMDYDSLLNRAIPGPGASEDVNERIASVLLGTLAIPGVTLDDVIGTTGFLNLESLDSEQVVKFMPSIMTEAFDDMRFPATRGYLFDRMRSRLRRAPDGTEVYRLDDDWNFSYLVTDADGNNPVYRNVILNFGVYTPAEENPTVQAHTQVMKTQQKVSPHMINVLDKISDGGRVPYNPDRLQEDGSVIDDFTVEWFTRDYAMPYEQAEPESPMRGLLPQVLALDTSFNHLQQRTYLEQRVIERAEARMRLYSQPVDKTEWDMTEVTPLIDSILKTLNINDPSLYSANEAMLDMLVRQYLGAPGMSKDQEGFFDIQTQLYKETLTIIRDNLREGMNPLHGGQVPLPHARLFLERVFKAQDGAARPWRPAAKGGRSGRVDANDWGRWVEAIIGQVKTSRANFETMFSSDLNGFWQSYIAVTPSTTGLPLTPNEMVNAELASPNKAEGFADLQARWDEITLNLSLDPAERALMKAPIILETMDRTIETYLGKDQVFNGMDAPNVIAAAMHDKKNQQGAWRSLKKLAKAEKPALADFVSEGRVTIDSHVHGTAFGRSLVNISIINRMLNPAIWVSGFIEVPVMSAFQNVADILTGQYLGAGGQTLARMFEDKAIQPQYTEAEVKALKGLARSLGSNKLWMAELMNELNYQVEIMKNDPRANQRASIKLEQAATAIARMISDPRFGTRMTAFARQYLGGVLEYLNATNSNQITVDQFVALMSRNPLAIKQLMNGEGLNAHQLGLNRLANTRGTKATLPGKVIMSPIHWLVSRESPLLNVPGHLLQIPFAFTNFNAGRLVTLTGMSGWDQLIAMFFDARKKPAVLTKIGLSDQDTWDNLDVIETVDLQRTFIRSGATLTMLMALGLQFGRLGLGGGDDEDRRRERLSKYLNVPNYLDPREPENSFTFADAIYLDHIPFLNNMFKNDAGNSAIVPHWIIQQFSAPIMGMARFFETGDFREIRYGFEAAYSALPNSIDRLIDQGDQLATQLVLEAQEEARKASGDPNAAAMTNNLLISAFGVLERALIENSFVNTLYIASDEYERNPFVLPKTDDQATDGLDRTQGTQLPQKTDARTAVVGPDGEIITPYVTRTGTDATLHNYTKNNAVASVLMSLFTGQGFKGSYNRENMAPKEKVIERPELTAEEGKALVYAAFAGQGGEFRLTESEIVRVLKANWEATTDERWDQAELEARAKIIYDANNGDTALTTVTQEGQEIFTKYGNKAVINSLFKGSVQLGDPSLRGFALTREQRDAIAEELLTEIKQDAINLGLGTEAANFVMNRIWYGDKETGTVGLQSIIYSQDIPISNKIRYNQLNVTFALGPDGRPWATPFTRSRLAQAFGIPLANVIPDAGPGTSLDKLGKVIDDVTGINTGLHAIVRQQEPELDPKDVNEILDKVAAKTLNPDTDPYVSRKKYNRGYGSGGGSYARPFFSRMDDLPDGSAARVDNIPFINSNSPYVRRSRINRERVFSDRGRLNEWQ